MIEKMMSSPKNLFLIDGLGAILSAFLLGVILVKFERIFGIPSTTLYFLATLPIFFAIYDLYCYRRKNDKLDLFLKVIAIINLLYCCLSIGFAFYHFGTITRFGWSYLLIEILFLVVLAVVEFKVAKRLISKE
jgi:putative flippase GtrA